MSLNLPKILIDVILSCISSSSFAVLFNGKATESFNPTCGPRQGNPLSPYLFPICIEHLSHMINPKVKRAPGRLSRPGGEAPLPTYCLLITFTSLKLAKTRCFLTNEIPNRFCLASDERFNGQKSEIYISPHVDRKMARRFRVSAASNLSKTMVNIWAAGLAMADFSRLTLRMWWERSLHGLEIVRPNISQPRVMLLLFK
ncbi:hypothetical protein Nepgr_003723 [Nepenthes gracilis]|uniref:Reverse transcriptase domain-containing protein n=1 Tax=Nepenthes gracilis TaxID=150966 RepID=A0AAD3S016_NEPGR|nr:hypothetical protein Nepgr_003723 [Nepenthes gracilis]